MRKFFLKLLQFYQNRRYIYGPLLSPFYLADHHCRFSPTCSQYAYGAVEKYGLFRGLFLGLRRLLRCHPFGKFGYDPVP